MKIKNDFKEEDRGIYAFSHSCIVCDSNQMVELHHILGRVSDSILNSALICRDCHEKYTSLDKSFLLKTTLRFLLKNDYRVKPDDIKFYHDNIKYYE